MHVIPEAIIYAPDEEVWEQTRYEQWQCTKKQGQTAFLKVSGTSMAKSDTENPKHTVHIRNVLLKTLLT